MVPFLLCLSGVLVLVMAAVVRPGLVHRFAIAGKDQPPPWQTEPALAFFPTRTFYPGPSLSGKSFSGLMKSEVEVFLDWVENQDSPPYYEMQCQDGLFVIRFPQAA